MCGVLTEVMLLNERCTICQERIEAAETVVCGECGTAIHAECAEFERTFNCPDCADEREIGAVEF